MPILSKHTNSSVHKSTEDLSLILQQVLELSREAGATDASVGVNHDRGFTVDVRMGSIETVAFNEDKGVGVTVYMGTKKGSASSSDTSFMALKNMVQAAIDIAKISAADPCFGLPDKELISNEFSDLDLYHPWDITPEQAIEKALQCEHYALQQDPRIQNSSGVSVSTHEFCQGYATTQDFMHISRSTRHGISCSLIANTLEGMQRDYEYSTARSAQCLQSIEAIASTAVSRTISRLNAKKLKTQKAPVIFSSRLSSGLIGAFISAITGSNLYRKQSFLLNSLDTQIFPTWMRIYEQPHLLNALGSACFDADGVPTRDNVFVEQGLLRQYVLSTFSARKLGMKTSANSGGVFNLTVEPNVSGFEAMLKQMDTGLLVTELMGQGVNGVTGDYSRGASGFWVENGCIQYPVEEITIAGRLKDIYMQILAIGDDFNPNVPTRCGSILINQMTIAGT